MITHTENNVKSKIFTEYAIAVIAKPTVPLPFNKDAIASPSFLSIPHNLAPTYPPNVLPIMPKLTSRTTSHTEFSNACPLNFVPIIVNNNGAKKPKVIELISNNVKGQEIGISPFTSTCHIQVEVVQLIQEKCWIIKAFLCKWIVLKVVARKKGLDVVFDGRLAVENIIVNVLSKLLNSGLS